ncbi:MAG TPA: SusD/RagB family nutrient-binding outer membrane lipoprotein [Chitinophaga sp.]|nr:SusD/RagB family nutrient-binding outer membrane lipoprotein [Chitinophaga sp.]
MRIQRLYITMIAALAVLSSCTKNFEEINKDPIRPTTITPGVLLGQMQYRLVNTSISMAKGFTHELMQVTAPRESTSGGEHRYVITEGSGNGIWNGFYSRMTDVEDLYRIASGLNEDNYKAISLIYKAWTYSILTDCFGDIPFSQAARASEGIVAPVFDKQKDIYVQLLDYLNTANDLLNPSKALTYGGDMVYSANSLSGGTAPGIVKWKKFCNSLRLRLLLRISKRNGEVNVDQQIMDILSNPVKYPVFTTITDDAIFRYPGINPYYNPYYNTRDLDWRQGDYYTLFFMNRMNADNDPRRAVWATTVKVNGVDAYTGIESGYPSTTVYVTDKNSSYKDALKTSPLLGVMMTYAELEFIKAELALKGFATGSTPKQHYENGITASIAQWGAVMPAGYLQQTGVAYNAQASAEEQLKQIILQKYYAYFFTDCQAWFEKRRTGYPELPRGSGIPAENQFPSRCIYPTYLQSLNPQNLQVAIQALGGKDISTVKGWWEK